MKAKVESNDLRKLLRGLCSPWYCFSVVNGRLSVEGQKKSIPVKHKKDFYATVHNCGVQRLLMVSSIVKDQVIELRFEGEAVSALIVL
jgi:hypothetical protein